MARMTMAQARALPVITYRPTKTARLYRLYDADGRLLYVGITTRPDMRERFNGHSRTKAWWPDVVTVELTNFAHEHEALAAERHAIRVERPVYNMRSGVR